MKLEFWLAIGSIALFGMFVGEMLSVYFFMTDIPDDFDYAQAFSPDPKILQFISIGVAPAGVLSAIAFIMSKRYGSKQVGTLIIIGGVVLLAGMSYCYTLVDVIPSEHVTLSVKYIPVLFIVLSFAVIGVGSYLLRQRKRRPVKEYF